MARSLASLERLGAHVALTLEDVPARERAIDHARAGFLRHDLAVRLVGSAGRGSPWAWATATVALAPCLVLLALSHAPAPLTFRVNGAASDSQAWLAAPAILPLQIDFSEGTKVRLEKSSRARVVEIDAHGARLSLESGTVHAEVVHKSDSVWKVVAGPYTVNVTGTIFDVSWDPNAEQLRVNVQRGSVLVREAGTGSEQAVHTAETLTAAASEHHFALSRQAAPASDEPPTMPPAVPDPTTGDARLSQMTPSEGNVDVPANQTGPRGISAWRTFARRGALREAFASADAAGFAQSCAGANPAELLLLGDGARLSGRPAQATAALLALRHRYPNDPRRAAAAFSLGKVSFDQRGANGQAAAWFATSLREQPTGPLAREASGRLIEALHRADDSAGARRAARDYLDKYPEGPHADLARSLLR